MDAIDAVAYLQTSQAIRDRCGQLFDLACRGQLEHFDCDLERLPAAADYVLAVMRTHYPDLNIPFHSRWRHFEVEGRSRLDRLAPQLSQSAIEQARLKFDLAVTSVLLDAGAGADWRYREPGTGLEFARSEGLAIASFHAFAQGLFSSHGDRPLQADAAGLERLNPKALAEAFQVSPQNPLVGVAGRVNLLQKLGIVLAQFPDLFGQQTPRPGGLVDYLLGQADSGGRLAAPAILTAILQGLGPIWPRNVILNGVSLGDVWPHPALPDTGAGSQLVPFHKLSQWLSYSLIEPLIDLGLTITDLDALTGLAEYRNGGLFIDQGVIVPRHSDVLGQPHRPDSTVVVEWRALTVMLLDRSAEQIRSTLGLSPEELPLAKVLQGGTWTAGRQIAREKRPGGSPPLQIISDGTVF